MFHRIILALEIFKLTAAARAYRATPWTERHLTQTASGGEGNRTTNVRTLVYTFDAIAQDQISNRLMFDKPSQAKRAGSITLV